MFLSIEQDSSTELYNINAYISASHPRLLLPIKINKHFWSFFI